MPSPSDESPSRLPNAALTRCDDGRQHHCGQSDDQRQRSGFRRPEEIDHADERDTSRGPQLRMRQMQIVKGIQGRECRRDDVVRAQQQSTEDRERLRPLTSRRVDSAAARKCRQMTS